MVRVCHSFWKPLVADVTKMRLLLGVVLTDVFFELQNHGKHFLTEVRSDEFLGFSPVLPPCVIFVIFDVICFEVSLDLSLGCKCVVTIGTVKFPLSWSLRRFAGTLLSVRGLWLPSWRKLFSSTNPCKVADIIAQSQLDGFFGNGSFSNSFLWKSKGWLGLSDCFSSQCCLSTTMNCLFGRN
jgi:hypothetical protein